MGSWRLQGAIASRYAHLAQTQRLHLTQHALLVLIGLLPPPQLRQHTVSLLVLRPVCLFLLVTLASCGVSLDIVVEERSDEGVGLCGADRGAARWAGVWVYRSRCRSLKGKPLLQTGAAEGVQAIEQGKRLVEQVGADLTLSQSVGLSQYLAEQQDSWEDAIRVYRVQYTANSYATLRNCSIAPAAFLHHPTSRNII
jgi:hypothetical protein